MALVGEVGELTEIFQWLTEEQSRTIMSGADSDDQDGDARRGADRVREELADVLILVLRLADVLGLSGGDLEDAVRAKIRINDAKYPAERVRGSARKYDQL